MARRAGEERPIRRRMIHQTPPSRRQSRPTTSDGSTSRPAPGLNAKTTDEDRIAPVETIACARDLHGAEPTFDHDLIRNRAGLEVIG